jgi:hypothetical protein
MLERFNPADFAGVVLDESSYPEGARQQDAGEGSWRCSGTRRIGCPAPRRLAPNDHMELGNQAEFLGVMTAAEMLAMFFISRWRRHEPMAA